MTIINNNNLKRSNITILITGLLVAFVTVGILAAHLDSKGDNLKASLNRINIQIEEVRAENADLQNKIAGMIEAQGLEELANEFQLEKDRKPQYMPISAQWELVSQL